MLINYIPYYRAKGMRYSTSLAEAPFASFDTLPRSSLYHYLSDDIESPDVDTSLLIFQPYTKKIILENVIDYVEPQGRFRKPMMPIREMMRPWLRKNLTRWQIDKSQPGQEAWRINQNPETLIVINYGYLDIIHEYLPVQMAEYDRWMNREKTLWTKVNEIANASARHQFVVYKLPTVLQGRTILDKYSTAEPSIQMTRIFGLSGVEGYKQLELWKWMGVVNRDRSVLSRVEPKNFNKVNLVFIGASGTPSIINMGYLNSWIKGQPNSTEFGSLIQYEALAMQKLTLKHAMLLNGVESEDDTVATTAAPTTKRPTLERVKVEPSAADPEEPVDNSSEIEPVVDEDEESTSLEETPIMPVDETEPLEEEDFGGPVGDFAVVDVAKGASAVQKTLSVSAAILGDIDKDLEELDRLSKQQMARMDLEENPEVEPVIDREAIVAKVYKADPPVEILKQKLASDAEKNLLTASEYRKITEEIENYRKSKDPYGSPKTREEMMVITPEEIAISPSDSEIKSGAEVPSKDMTSSTLQAFDRKYVKEVLKKDVLKMVDGVQVAGVVVRNHEITRHDTVMGSHDVHTLELRSVSGKVSNVKFSLPVVDEEGVFMASGNKYLMRKQRVDLPIRKIAPQIVSLSTYYGKTFVQTNPKVSNSSLSWITRQVNMAIFTEGSYIASVAPGNVFDNDKDFPYIYNAMAEQYESITTEDLTLVFDYKKRSDIAPEILKQLEVKGRIYCGSTKSGHSVVVDKADQFYSVHRGVETPLGKIEDVLRLEKSKMPLDFSEVRIFSKYIPTGLVLSYYLGFKGLLALLNVSYRTVPARKQKALEEHEFAVSFRDISYIFSTKDRVASLILAGLTEYEKILKMYESREFDHKAVYLNVLMAKQMSAIYINELDQMEHGFVDPISQEVLEDMGEPLTFTGLIVRSTELLTTFHHPSSQSRKAMRERGYERFAGAVYKELMTAIRKSRNGGVGVRSKISMSPFEVWNAILKDNSVKIVEDINPIQNLKESEVITYAGTGGRDKDSMTKETRAFTEDDVGILSESTVDSSAVGTIAYLSANPNYKNLRGMMKEEKDLDPTNMVSTSALISPASFNDNPKRVMFIGTQHSHTIATAAARQPHVRTGYEFMVAKRTGKMFATAAKMDGKVLSITERGIVVEYLNGEKDGIELGRVYGRAEGTVYPHDIVTPYKVGDKFKKDDIIAYNTKFFEPDFIDPKNIIMKISRAVNVAFIEGDLTHEDSSAISEEIGSMFETEVSKTKSFVVSFKENVSHVRKPGEKVGPKDILLYIEDEITANTGQFSEQSLDVLKRKAATAPRAGLMGVVERIEVYYHGDKRDMTASLKKLADKSDSDLAAICKATNRPVVTGAVTEEHRVKGNSLDIDMAEIRIYLTVKNGTGVGDKAVFGHQMKSTVAEVLPYRIHTESGEKVDAVFSYRSVANRGVLSPSILGTTITLLDACTKRAVDIYEGNVK